MLKKEHPGLIAVHEDRQLEEAILSALAAERLLEVEDLRVLVVERVAYVDGRASSYRRKQAIGKRARSVVGLRKVVNRLRVVPEAHVQDQALAERARTALAANPFLKEEDITVRCRDRAIELSGTVDAASLRLLAEDVVWSIGGVRHVNNELKVSFSRALQEQELAQRIEQVLLYSLDLGDQCASRARDGPPARAGAVPRTGPDRRRPGALASSNRGHCEPSDGGRDPHPARPRTTCLIVPLITLARARSRC
jgi:osmotically-inducible protein OsmY